MRRPLDALLAAYDAAARRARGRPVWDHTLRLGDVFHNDELTFEQIRDTVVARLRESGWPDRNADLAELVDELAETTDTSEFNQVWNEVYDHADTDRVWIDIFFH